jgi:hypothetical protein
MTNETKKKLIEAGRQDLVDIHEFKILGYAGIDSTGNMVDRRLFIDAIPLQPNSFSDTPPPKPVTQMLMFVYTQLQDYKQDLQAIKSEREKHEEKSKEWNELLQKEAGVYALIKHTEKELLKHE